MTNPNDPAFSCRPQRHVVTARYSAIHYESRLAGEGLAGGPVGFGTDPDMALADLCRQDARAVGLENEIRDDPDE